MLTPPEKQNSDMQENPTHKKRKAGRPPGAKNKTKPKPVFGFSRNVLQLPPRELTYEEITRDLLDKARAIIESDAKDYAKTQAMQFIHKVSKEISAREKNDKRVLIAFFDLDDLKHANHA